MIRTREGDAMRVRGYLRLLLMLGIIQHGHRESAVSAVGAEEEAAEADPTPASSLTNTEDRGHRERVPFSIGILLDGKK